MTRRFLSVAVAITASTALLLTGCSSGGSDDDAPDKIKGSGADTDSSASAGPSAKPGGAMRPDITLPKSVQVTFEGWTNSDPKLQAILDDGKERLRASYAAIINKDPQDDAFTFYSESDALRTGTEWVKGFTDKNLVLIGKGRVFQPQPRISPDGSGTLFYCVDEGKGSTKDTKTGKVTATPADDALVLYRTKLRKTKEGVWKTTMVQTERGACK
ncbi:hypothetical protein DEJ48_38980 [Streptomyces venezuelae]|uniref:Lipoprotein n=1 Tax=Streptomyces venezuelae TaxID=54571 RepID=A0A5P2CCX0_STRVZ|nr:hypothetical protein [Streptomyces venezuelae]QES38599.1 hypothetical protein DEJ48_38980 [Streptomyces venezuelae]